MDDPFVLNQLQLTLNDRCLFLPPSQRLEPEYIEVATAFAGDGTTVVAKLDADEHKELAARYGIKGYPTLKLFRSVL